MYVIGLLGGIASGKSLVAKQLEQLGAARLDADQAGHDVLRMPEVEELIRARWGSAVFDSTGRVNRRALGKIVFAAKGVTEVKVHQDKAAEDNKAAEDKTEYQATELEELERITHPRIAQLLAQQITQLTSSGCRVAVLDAPVMLKAGWDRICDEIWFIDAPREMRLKRALSRGWTEEEFGNREAFQEPVDLKRKRATLIITNTGTPEATLTQVTHLWHSGIENRAEADRSDPS